MAGLLIFGVISVLGLANAAVVRLLRVRGAGRVWWRVLAVAWLAGAGLGFWLALFFEYRPTPDLRVFGAPVPGAFLHWEGPPGEERWVDFITPFPLLFAGSNILVLALLAGLPIAYVFLLCRHVDAEGMIRKEIV